MASFATSGSRRKIVALQGGSRSLIQTILMDFARESLNRGLRVAGVVEVPSGSAEGGCKSLALKDLSTGSTIPISQDLGPGSTACNLDTTGLASACSAVERAIVAGVDLVVLNKFGKVEAERGGLCDAFRAAVSADAPIVTAVSPSLSDAWNAFTGDLAEPMAPDMTLLRRWWSDYCEGIHAIAAA